MPSLRRSALGCWRSPTPPNFATSRRSRSSPGSRTKTVCGSESSIYRILRRKSNSLTASAPDHPRRGGIQSRRQRADEVYSWDITYLRAAIRGTFYFLYLFVDIWSRKIVGFTVEEEQNDELAAATFKGSCETNGIDPRDRTSFGQRRSDERQHDVRTLEDLGVMPSFSRPGVSDDNAFSEALFRTIKFRPGYPRRFESLQAARAWVNAFVAWYNDEQQAQRNSIRHPGSAPRRCRCKDPGQTSRTLRACTSASPRALDGQDSKLGATRNRLLNPQEDAA